MRRRSEAESLRRLAWWLDATSPDDTIRRRVAEWRTGTPPWAEPVWLEFIAVSLGLVVGLAFSRLWPAAEAGWWQTACLAGCGACFGLVVAADRGEAARPDLLPFRVAAYCLTLPYLLLGFLGLLAVTTPLLGPDGFASADLPSQLVVLAYALTALAIVVLLGLAAASARSMKPATDDSMALYAVSFRLGAAALFIVGLSVDQLARLHFLGYYPLGLGRWGYAYPLSPVYQASIAGGFLSILVHLPLNRLAADLAERWSRRQHRLPRWLAEVAAPLPLSFETTLLRTDQSPASWQLAADYASLRRYSLTTWREVGFTLWRRGGPADRAVAACFALAHLAADRRAAPALAERAWQRLITAGEQAGPLLRPGFWGLLAQWWPTPATRRRALDWLLQLAAGGHLPGSQVADSLTSLRWTDTLAESQPADRLTSVARALQASLVEDGGVGLNSLLEELDRWASRQPDGGSCLDWARLSEVAEAIVRGLLTLAPSPAPVRGALELRLAAYRIGAGEEAAVPTWYVAARQWETARPEARPAVSAEAMAWLWSLVLTRVTDREEAARQTERFSSLRRGRGTSGSGEEGLDTPLGR